MKCPLQNTTTHYPDGRVGIDTWDCLKEECALYHKGLEVCGLFLIHEYLALITAQLVELNKTKGGN